MTMSMLLEDSDGVGNMSLYDYYQNRIKNNKILIFRIDEAIDVLMSRTKSADGVGEYTIDTGQDKQTVKARDIPYLHTWRQHLIEDTNRLLRAVGREQNWVQVVPGY